jgi:hypothetical protein
MADQPKPGDEPDALKQRVEEDRRYEIDRTVDLSSSTGSHYYIAGRFAAFAWLNPVVGNLLHHAVEMYLKGTLSKTATLKELKDKLGHHLPKLWDAFKGQIDDPALSRFDRIIAGLHQYEELRYPDSVLSMGMQSAIEITRPTSAPAAGTAPVPGPRAYKLCLEEIDELIRAIFQAASRNPKFYLNPAIEDASQYLFRDNSAIRAG